MCLHVTTSPQAVHVPCEVNVLSSSLTPVWCTIEQIELSFWYGVTSDVLVLSVNTSLSHCPDITKGVRSSCLGGDTVLHRCPEVVEPNCINTQKLRYPDVLHTHQGGSLCGETALWGKKISLQCEPVFTVKLLWAAFLISCEGVSLVMAGVDIPVDSVSGQMYVKLTEGC